MVWTRLLEVLLGRWRLMLAVAGSVLAVAAVVVALLPERYTATASVLVDLNPSDPLAAQAPAQPLGQSHLSTQIDLIKSNRVLLRALEALRAAGDPLADLRELWREKTDGQGDYADWWAGQMREDLQVRPTRDSGVLVLAFTAEDGHAAARAANALMQAYLDTALELRIEPARKYGAFFDERAAALRKTLVAAQERLAEYQRRTGVVAGLDQRLDIENMRLLELSSQLTALQAASSQSIEREAAALRQGDRLAEVTAHPVLVELNTQLATHQAKLGELTARLGENHPQVRETLAAVNQLKGRIEAESARVASGLGVNSSVDRARVAQLQRALQVQREKVLKLRTSTDAMTLLEREVQHAQRNYDAVLAQASRSQLESEARHSNLTVLQRAVPPQKRSSPQVGTILSVVALFAVLLAVGAALLAEHRDARVRVEDDIRLALALPLLVTLPSPGRTASRRSPGAAPRLAGAKG